jgi:hypothetical protein
MVSINNLPLLLTAFFCNSTGVAGLLGGGGSIFATRVEVKGLVAIQHHNTVGLRQDALRAVLDVLQWMPSCLVCPCIFCNVS